MRTQLQTANSAVECAGFVRQLGEALLIGGATLEAGTALLAGGEVVTGGALFMGADGVAGAALLAGADGVAPSGPVPSMSMQRKRSSSSITQVWVLGHAGAHSVRRHSPLLRSQAKPGVQFAQHPPVVARYTPVMATVAPRPRAASLY